MLSGRDTLVPQSLPEFFLRIVPETHFTRCPDARFARLFLQRPFLPGPPLFRSDGVRSRILNAGRC